MAGRKSTLTPKNVKIAKQFLLQFPTNRAAFNREITARLQISRPTANKLRKLAEAKLTVIKPGAVPPAKLVPVKPEQELPQVKIEVDAAPIPSPTEIRDDLIRMLLDLRDNAEWPRTRLDAAKELSKIYKYFKPEVKKAATPAQECKKLADEFTLLFGLPMEVKLLNAKKLSTKHKSKRTK